MASAVALLLLISSPSVPELIFELLKYRPVPPPPAVLLYNFVTADAVGVLAAPENVSVSFTTISPVPFAFNVKLPLDASDVIEVIFVRSESNVIVTVSASVAAVDKFVAPAICTEFPDVTATTAESSPLNPILNPPPAT